MAAPRAERTVPPLASGRRLNLAAIVAVSTGLMGAQLGCSLQSLDYLKSGVNGDAWIKDGPREDGRVSDVRGNTAESLGETRTREGGDGMAPGKDSGDVDGAVDGVNDGAIHDVIDAPAGEDTCPDCDGGVEPTPDAASEVLDANPRTDGLIDGGGESPDLGSPDQAPEAGHPESCDLCFLGSALSLPSGLDPNINPLQIPIVDKAVNIAMGSGSQYTVMLWAKPISPGSNGASLVYKWQTGVGTAQMWLGIEPDYTVRFFIDDFSRKGWQGFVTIQKVTDSQWNHLAFVRRTDNTMHVFINGVENNDGKAPVYITQTTSPALNTGPWVVGQRFAGMLDELSVWNRALSETEIGSHLCQKVAGNESGLVGLWNFDSASGTTVPDDSSLANDGTLLSVVAVEPALATCPRSHSFPKELDVYRR